VTLYNLILVRRRFERNNCLLCLAESWLLIWLAYFFGLEQECNRLLPNVGKLIPINMVWNIWMYYFVHKITRLMQYLGSGKCIIFYRHGLWTLWTRNALFFMETTKQLTRNIIQWKVLMTIIRILVPQIGQFLRLGSRDSSVGIAKGYRLEDRGSSPDRGKMFLFSIVSRPAMGPMQSLNQW
jgi:hypothetical protein